MTIDNKKRGFISRVLSRFGGFFRSAYALQAAAVPPVRNKCGWGMSLK
jgi:hypothetical protein